MPRDGSNGQYNLPVGNPVSPDTVIESTWANTTMQDLALAITESIAIDGQTTATGNLPMGGFRHTNVSDPSLRNQYLALGMAQDGLHQRIQGIAGADNLTGTLVGGATAYSAGAIVSLYAVSTNTGPMTLSYNGIGAKSLVDAELLPIPAGAVKPGDFLMALYTGSVFRLLTAVQAAASAEVFAIKASGQERPPAGDFPQLTIASPTSINVPAGTAWIVQPGADTADEATEVSWAQQTINLEYLTTSFSTTIVVDVNGNIQQISGRAIGAAFREFAVIGVVEHLTGVANSVVTKPMIFGDETYRATDVASLLTNSLINGGLVTGNAVSLMQLDISAGNIFSPGGSANTVDSPNVISIPQQNNLSFRTLAGQNTVGGSAILNAPVTQYDPDGSGVVTTLPSNGNTVVHRLYFLYGRYIWVFGQYIYSSVENACSLIEVDRTRYKPSIFLNDATLLAEIISVKNASSLTNPAQAVIIAPGGINFSVGSPGGITEAPIDGTPYGRQNAGWVNVLGAVTPLMQIGADIQGTAPFLDITQTPYAPGTLSVGFWADTFKWASVEVTNPDDKMYIRSFDPANGNLRFSTIFDLATGAWVFPGALSAGAVTATSFAGDGANVTNVNHAGLTNLTTGDPHTQYLNNTRGDARYPLRDANFTTFAVVTALPGTPDPNTIYFVTG